MTNRITANQFFQVWKQVGLARKSDLLNKWSNSKQYTSLILYDEDAVLKDIARKLGLLCYSYGQHGYYWIDGVLYKPEDLFPDCPKDQTWLRRIRVAFEHENDFYSWLNSEVGRLLLVNSELRVLVTYPNEKIDWNALDDIHNFIATTDDSDMISNSESFLIIFGWKNENQYIEWEGRVFKSNKWLQLE